MTKLRVVSRNWYIADAKYRILGRFSSTIVKYLIGKHKIEYAPYVDIGDYVIVVNASKVIVSGNKNDKKIYYHHTGYSGGIKKFTFGELIVRSPEKVIEISVKGMLPKGPLGRSIYKRLRVYSDNIHSHVAQNPCILNVL